MSTPTSVEKSFRSRLFTVLNLISLLALVLVCAVEIKDDLAEGISEFELHHGLAIYSIAKLVEAVSEISGVVIGAITTG